MRKAKFGLRSAQDGSSPFFAGLDEIFLCPTLRDVKKAWRVHFARRFCLRATF
jgi:hypothetical protein